MEFYPHLNLKSKNQNTKTPIDQAVMKKMKTIHALSDISVMLKQTSSKNNIIPDIVLVPLLAFDNKLNRIGYGKGYYDRALKKINKIKKKAIFIGIAFSFQKSIKVPTNKHDVKLDYIFTERGIISSK